VEQALLPGPCAAAEISQEPVTSVARHPNRGGKSMGSLLLHNPWVHLYVFYVGVLSLALFWDHLRRNPD